MPYSGLLTIRRRGWLVVVVFQLPYHARAKSATQGDLQDWLRNVEDLTRVFRFGFPDFQAPLKPSEMLAMACTGEVEGRCGGSCIAFRRSQEEKCVEGDHFARLSTDFKMTCFATTQPFQLCPGGCGKCVGDLKCNTNLGFGFCSLPVNGDSVFIQLQRTENMYPKPESTLDQLTASITPSISGPATQPLKSAIPTISLSIGGGRDPLSVVSLFGSESGKESITTTENVTSATESQSYSEPSPSLTNRNSSSTSLPPSGSPSIAATSSAIGPGEAGVVDKQTTQSTPVGIIVGGVAGTLALIALMILLLCDRRRKARRVPLFQPALMECSNIRHTASQATLPDADTLAQRPPLEPRGYSFASWTETVKLPDFGYQKSIKSRPSSMADSFSSTDSTVILREISKSRTRRRSGEA